MIVFYFGIIYFFSYKKVDLFFQRYFSLYELVHGFTTRINILIYLLLELSIKNDLTNI
ncbi:hypothetical protein SAMN05444267_100881 [Chryseobacterium polytrichastri]|uniref:Uncharacterized protein n=1 Tax=Chryseobacterium polytrichastri TaxID=1302687 RepID=A0A1M6VMJ4_9FLAO|nr:hypothetical protein SAMN05444267_100881 [Chryseobacterium polytrichastri]